MKVNIGGDRIGSGAKMNVDLHNYGRSTHNLSKRIQTSLAPGVLYPCYVNVGLNGDKFDIDIEEITRTLPTRGPLFGKFKMQIDCYVGPMRLYHGVLHNNPVNIGLQMKNVILPSYRVSTFYKKNDRKLVHPSNLWSYLGLKGLGRFNYTPKEGERVKRNVKNAIPYLLYYDIFKNYYANKQEDDFFVISKSVSNAKPDIEDVYIYNDLGVSDFTILNNGTHWVIDETHTIQPAEYIFIQTDNVNFVKNGKLLFKIYDTNGNDVTNSFYVIDYASLYDPYKEIISEDKNPTRFKVVLLYNGTSPIQLKAWNQFWATQVIASSNNIALEKCSLENIDKMREMLLSIKLGETFDVGVMADNESLAPYYMFNDEAENDCLSSPLQGLCVKTYQSDLFNNWIKTETIDGSNGISEITKVDTSNGLELDTLNLAQKVYNMLNRIAVAGGTYEDWQQAVYSYDTVRKAETPMYVGGYSSMIYFDEIIASTGQNSTPNGKQVLGELGGRGKQYESKGGHIKFEIEEPSIIMIMVSLTPLTTNSQGNKWFLTEIGSIDDLHKPALDGIGYQDLLVEQMTWNGSTINKNGEVVEKLSAGKTVAWINYMTDIDECYADFADEEGNSFMVLNRNYNIEFDANGNPKYPSDITTYIDPKKYNYVFAYNELDAQNFWTEIYFKVEARRLMSAKQIPNL